MYMGIRCLTKGFLLEWLTKSAYEYQNEAILSKKDVLARIGQLLDEAEAEQEDKE